MLAALLLLAAFASAPALATQTINGITIDENMPQARRGVAYSHTIPISGGTGPYTVTILGVLTLPGHLTLSSAGVATGVISCNESNGNKGQDIRVTDSTSPTPIVADFTGNRGLAINVTAGPAGTCVTLTIAPLTLPNPAVGVAYSQTITASGGLGPYTYAVTAGALPAGLALSASTGLINGTPTTAGAFSFTVTASDAADSTGSRAYSGTTSAALTVNPATLPNGTVGTAYSQTASASGGTTPYTFSVSVGALPAGLSLNAGTGAITGTPTTAATSNFTIRATDSLGAVGSRAYSVTINAAITVNPATLPNGTVGTAYSQTVSATGGTGSYAFSVTAGTLPAGLSLNAGTGAITGAPTTAATSNFTITATDGVGATGSRAYSVTVNSGVAVNPATLPNGTAGTAYSQTVSASGGTAPYTFSVSVGALPAGLTLNAATGVISGTPTTAATSNFTIRATDSIGAIGTRAYSVTINPAIVVNPATLPGGTVGTAYSQTVSATGGTGAKTFSVSAGALPAGLTLNAATGVISGTPTTAAASTFTIRATDTIGAIGSRAYTVTIAAAIVVNPATLPGGTVGTAYSQTVSATGGTGAKTFSVSAGALPAGLTLNAVTGVIAGTPTTAAASNFTIRATDTLGATGTRAYSVTINPAIVVNPATLPGGTLGSAYSQTVTATGGTGSYTFSVSAGSLGAGLALNAATGVISGTPTATGVRNFTIRATDGNATFGSRAYSVTIAAAIVVNPATLPGGTVGTAYSQTVSATGGTGAKTFSVSVGSLPAGLTLNAATGVIAGTPTTAGPNSFTVRATDSIGAIGTRAYSVTINPAIVVNPATLPNGTSGTPYSQTVSATGGSGTFTYSVSAGALGAGLALNAATGVISGTPTTVGVRNFTIRATDTLGAIGSRAYTVTIAGAIVVNPATLPGGTVGTAYSQTVTATGGTGAKTFSVSAGALPAGLALNATTGVIAGTPTTAAASTFTIRATDTIGAIGSRAYTVTIAAAPIVVNPITLPGGAVSSVYGQTVSATGGSGSYTFSVSAGSLGAGLALNAATGVISGTPTVAGVRNFTIRATDSLGAIGSRAYSITINAAIVVNPATLPNGTVGAAYSQTVSATGGTGTYTFSVSAGALPAGLSLNGGTGAITGTPTAAATSNFTITATDGVGATGARAYTVTIAAAPIVVNPSSLPNGAVGTAYSQTVSATGGNGSFTFSVSAGALPAGLSLNASSGVISGTPSSPGPVSFTIRATDGTGAFGTRAYTVTIAAAPIDVNPATLPNGTVGVAYSQTVSATGGTGSYTFSVSAGGLPAGLSLNASTGVISGTSTAAGTSNFTITATDGLGATGSRAYSIVVNAAISVNPATLPNGTVGTAYSQSVTATGGTGSYSFSVTVGSLPAGLSLNAASGAVTGTPTSAATSNFTVTATDGLGATGSRAYSVTINASISVNPATLPNGTVGVAYSQAVSATGGTGSYTFSVTAGSLPAGLSLNVSTGAITGTPTSAATSNFTITATDGLAATGSRAYAVTINAGITVNPATLPNGTVGSAYSQSVSATGGTGSYTFSVTAGSLPAGLSLNAATGAIAGTPTSAATSNFTITATDGLAATGSRAYSVTMNAGITVNPATLPNGTVGAVYSQAVSATGGTGSYTFSVTVGSLPAGLSLNGNTGAISGTPTTAATSNFTISATDGLGATGSRAYSVTINAGIAVGPASLPATTLGVAYNQTVSATGGTGSYTFSVSSGSLPAGLSLNTATGAITGTSTTAATSNFTITATDGLGATGSRAYTVVVNPAIAVNPATLPNSTVGAAYSQTVSATGGTGSYTFNVTTGALPAGLSLNASTGLIFGTPTSAGTSNFTITATDTVSATGSRAYAVTVNGAIAVNPASLPATTLGVAYNQTVSATGGNGTYTFSVSVGALPAGLSLNSATGVISGTSTAASTSNFTIAATDSLGATGSRAYSVAVNAAVTVNPASLPAGAVGAAYAQTVSATGGSGTYTFSVSAGSLPPGFALNPASGVLAGTPTFAATYNFSITATDALGASAARAYSLTFIAAVTVGPATLPTGVAGTAYSQTISATGGTGSYTFSVSAGTLPAGLSLNPSTGVISGTPTTTATSNFTITATDGSGFVGSRAYALTVTAPTLSLVSPVSGGIVGSPYNQAIVVTGGTAPYSYAVTGGQLPPGLSLNPTSGALTGVPTASGTYPFTVTVTDANGASGAFAQSVSIVARPDPTLDPSVRGVIAGQVSAAARFGAAQIDNVTSRMRMLHLGYDPCSTQIEISTNIRWEREQTPAGETAAAGGSQERRADERERSGCERPFAVWAGGNIDFGFLRPSSATNRSNFRSSGLTLGADTRAGEGLVVGAALGFARDTTDSDAVGIDNTAHAQNLMLYASYEPAKSIFIDAMVGYGSLAFDAPRWQSTDMVMLSASREGSQFFGSLGVGAVLRAQGMNVAPYARFDVVRSRFDAYSESGAGSALNYGATSVGADSVAIGLYLGYSMQVGAATLEPGLRLEQRRVHSGGVDQSVAYADMPGANYMLRQAGESDGLTSAALSLLLRFGFSGSIGLEYSYTGSHETFRNESLRAIFRAPF